MTALYSDQVTNLNATPPVRVKVNQLHGRMRYALGLFTAAASPPAISDTIAFVRLPVGARILGYLSLLSWSTGGAGDLMEIGDIVDPNRHLAATAVTTAGQAAPNLTNASGASFETSNGDLDNGDPGAANDCEIRGTVSGSALAAAAQFALHMAYVQD